MAQIAQTIRDDLSDHPDDLTVWLEERFRDIGFNALQTYVLAGRRRDWHKARDMVDRGCEPDVAFDILA